MKILSHWNKKLILSEVHDPMQIYDRKILYIQVAKREIVRTVNLNKKYLNYYLYQWGKMPKNGSINTIKIFLIVKLIFVLRHSHFM